MKTTLQWKINRTDDRPLLINHFLCSEKIIAFDLFLSILFRYAPQRRRSPDGGRKKVVPIVDFSVNEWK